MQLDPGTTLASLHTGVSQLYALAVAYSLSVIGAVVLIVVGYVVAGLVYRTISGGLKHIDGFDATLRLFIAAAARYAVLILIAVMVLGQFGVQTASIVAALGAIGLAIGLALQGTLQNIAAGMMLLTLRPFRVGEDIEVGSMSGTVEEIGLFATELRTSDGVFLFAPNSTLWNQPVRNYTRNGMRREEIVVPVSAGDDVEALQRELMSILQADSRVSRQPGASVFLSAIGSEPKLTLRYWTSVRDRFAARTSVIRQVGSRLRKQAEA